MPHDGETIFAKIPFLLTRCSADLRYLFASDAYAAMIGRRPQDVVGRKIVEILGEQGFQAIQPHVDAVLSGERVEYETNVNFAGVGDRLLHVIYTPENDQHGKVHGWIASIIDITEKRQAEERLAAELRAMTMLREISTDCVRYDITPEECLQKILDAAVVIARAQKGTLQVFDPASNALRIAAQRGFGKPFLEFFEFVEDTEASSCGAALRAGAPVIVDDIGTSRIFAGRPSLDILLDENVRAVISIPLNSSHGYTLGMLSVHFREPLKAECGEIYYLDLAARLAADYVERRKAAETERLLLAEVQHRSANLLAVVLAIARRTICEIDRASFEGRIHALAESNRQIVNSHAGEVQLRDLVHGQTRTFASQITIEGPDIAVPATHAQNLGMVVHELTTNAVKHGALRTATGTIAISWEAERSPTETLRLRWKERGGPTILPPSRTGFGTGLVRGLFPDAELDFAPQGLCCSLEIRLRGEDDVTGPPG